MLLHHIATGGALELAQLAAVQERQRRLGADLLSQLLDRGIDPRLAQSLITEAGLDLAASVLAVARAQTDQDCAELHRKLARSHLPHLLLDRDHLLYVVLPEPALDGKLAAALAQSARIGASARLATAARLPEAVQEARWALGAAEAENRALVRYGDQTALLLPRSVTEAQALVSRILGPLVTHDAEHGSARRARMQRGLLEGRRDGQIADLRRRPDDQERPAHDLVLRDGTAPRVLRMVARVIGVAAVVPHHP